MKEFWNLLVLIPGVANIRLFLNLYWEALLCAGSRSVSLSLPSLSLIWLNRFAHNSSRSSKGVFRFTSSSAFLYDADWFAVAFAVKFCKYLTGRFSIECRKTTIKVNETANQKEGSTFKNQWELKLTQSTQARENVSDKVVVFSFASDQLREWCEFLPITERSK